MLSLVHEQFWVLLDRLRGRGMALVVRVEDYVTCVVVLGVAFVCERASMMILGASRGGC